MLLKTTSMLFTLFDPFYVASERFKIASSGAVKTAVEEKNFEDFSRKQF